jgi:nucleotide-binding universal stress UspA family protein
MNGRNVQPSPSAVAHSSPERSAPVVLVALDGSAAAATALPVAQRLAQHLKMPLHILHVATSPIPPADAARHLHLDVMAVAPAVELDMRVGDPATELLRAIEAPNTYLTVLTTHGRAIEPGRHLGHVAEQVIAQTMRPILLIRPEAAAAASAAIEARRFLLPLDGTAATARALGRITDIVRRLRGSYDVLFVADPMQLAAAATSRSEDPGNLGIPRYVDQLQHEWPNWMHEVCDHLSACTARYPLGVSVRVHVASVAGPADGTISSVVLQFVADHRDDVIVLVRRSRLERGHAEILRTLLDQTPCPVLLTGTPDPIRPHMPNATATA